MMPESNFSETPVFVKDDAIFGKTQKISRYIMADDMSIATGSPTKETVSIHSQNIPIWSFSGETANQSVAGTIHNLPADCDAVKIEIVMISMNQETNPSFEDVYQVHLSQGAKEASTAAYDKYIVPVRTALPSSPLLPRIIELDSYYATDPELPLNVRIERLPDDPADTFIHPTGLVMVRVTPLKKPDKPCVVQDVPGYNSWPMIQAIGPKLVCAYRRGAGHSLTEGNVYARTSMDGGKTWTPETLVANTPDYGESAIGKGLDANGAMLLWVRCCGPDWHHDLYRSIDGENFTRIATPKLDPIPMQITDVFPVPSIGLMALWFAGIYHDDGFNSWGTLISHDNGATWTQRVIEEKLSRAEWPTEPAAVYLGDGKILVIARTECVEKTTQAAQFQLESTDYGATWTRSRTNIGDVGRSTPSLILDRKTGLLSNYYYHRGRGILRRRVVKIEDILGNPLGWSNPETIALGSTFYADAGNVNATIIENTHFLVYYSGEDTDTSIVITTAIAPKMNKK